MKWLALILSLNTLFLCAQFERAIHFTTENGLSSNQVYDVIQDDFGYIWISSDNGLNRFDGYEFEQFSLPESDPSNVVFRFYKDKNDFIWFSTSSRNLYFFKGKKPSFTLFPLNNYIKGNRQSLIIEYFYFEEGSGDLIVNFCGRLGHIRISARGELISREFFVYQYLDEDPSYRANFRKLTYVQTSNTEGVVIQDTSFIKGPYHNSTDTMYLNLQDYYTPIESISPIRFFGVHGKGYTVYGGGEHFFIKKEGEVKVEHAEAIITAIGKISDSTFYVSTFGEGVSIYDSNGSELQHILPGEHVTKLFCDAHGGTWITTLYNGCYYYPRKKFNSLASNKSHYITSLSFSRALGLIAGCAHGDILVKKKLALSELIEGKMSKNSYVNYSIGFTQLSCDGHINFIPERAKVFYSPSENCYSEVIVLNKDTLFLAYSTTGIYNVGKVKSVCSLFWRGTVKSLAVCRNKLYAATVEGLFMFHDIQEKPVHIKNKYLENARVNALEVFRDSLLLIGTQRKGIFVYDGERILETGIWNAFEDEPVRVIKSGNDSTFFVGTKSALYQFHLSSSIQMARFTVNDGLLNNEINDLEIHNDTLWAGTGEGISYCSLYEQNQSSKKKSYLDFRGVMVNDKSVGFKSFRNLPYSSNKIRIDFSEMAFDQEGKVNYQYRLKGYEKQWNKTQSTFVLYNALPVGDYEFIVKAETEKNQRNQISLPFTIYPPFWETWWFILFAVLVLVYFVYLFFRYRILIYNADLVRSLMRAILKQFRKEAPYMIVKSSGKEIKLYTAEICFVKSAGNYLEIHCDDRMILIRQKIGEFLDLVPDKLEFIRIHRSIIVRIEKVTEKGKNLVIVNDTELKVSESFADALKKIEL